MTIWARHSDHISEARSRGRFAYEEQSLLCGHRRFAFERRVEHQPCPSDHGQHHEQVGHPPFLLVHPAHEDRKSTRLNSSHLVISYAVFCLKKKKIYNTLILSITMISAR